MGQQQTKSSKTVSNDLQLIQMPPESLVAFALLLRDTPIQRNSGYLFSITNGSGAEFVIKTSREVKDLADYKGFVEVFANKTRRIFAGTVNGLKRDGFGIEFNEKEQVFYRGEFLDDLYHGWGQTVKFQGEFKRGKKEGWGKWSDADARVFYEGYFSDDKFNGIGYLNLQVEEVPKFIAEDRILRPEEKVSQKYAGEWLDGKMHGKGKLSTAEEVYKGNFSQGQYSGSEILTRNGKPLEGNFSNGQPL